jgi:hypothetical protein
MRSGFEPRRTGLRPLAMRRPSTNCAAPLSEALSAATLPVLYRLRWCTCCSADGARITTGDVPAPREAAVRAGAASRRADARSDWASSCSPQEEATPPLEPASVSPVAALFEPAARGTAQSRRARVGVSSSGDEDAASSPAAVESAAAARESRPPLEQVCPARGCRGEATDVVAVAAAAAAARAAAAATAARTATARAGWTCAEPHTLGARGAGGATAS